MVFKSQPLASRHFCDDFADTETFPFLDPNISLFEILGLPKSSSPEARELVNSARKFRGVHRNPNTESSSNNVHGSFKTERNVGPNRIDFHKSFSEAGNGGEPSDPHGLLRPPHDGVH